ncbi:hypothetical protein PIIN_03484 [Serendipita indica DSM 11827]|uniref:Uncharacterized protein n=1 Tax=Serendipita indica (strain DSM 11827) TaxID=1109443 RepID=G4TDX9_SERID|nr:hypothetical protein PIIN_03484 [Serendipita indica DSM 11827]
MDDNKLKNEVDVDMDQVYNGPQKPVVVILVGLVGSGKSTFAKALETHFPQFRRLNQDELKDRRRVERLTLQTLSEGLSVIIDRTNIDQKQRKTWVDIADQFSRVEAWVITMNTPYEECAARLRTRTDHPTIKNWATAQVVLKRFSNEFEEPSPMEGFDKMYDLAPHPTGIWEKKDIAKVLREIESSPSTRIEGSSGQL